MSPFMLAGIVLVGIAAIWWLVRWENRRQAAKIEAINLSASEARAKICLNSEFICRIRHATTAEELLALDEEVQSQADELFGDDFANLRERIKARLRAFE